jgi:NAD(P)-dependent dehydrogenase (short-subunit alcohol dehydrogenase family)
VTERTIVITGASDGIGAAAARALSAGGDQVVVVGRSSEKTRAIADSIGAQHFLADFSRLADVRNLAATLLSQYPTIDVLANNAGGIMGERELTEDGHEKSKARVINTSSAANRIFGKFAIDDLDAEKKYNPNLAYGNAKLANILFTKELHRRYSANGITTAAFHPGVVATGFAAESTSPMRHLYAGLASRLMLTPEAGADTLVWLASAKPGIDWESGTYYAKRKPAKMNRQANDPGLASGLWERSLTMVERAPV